MQVFLPFTNFAECAAILDNTRLVKQQTECLQILKTISGKSRGWKNHPAVLMWQNSPVALSKYTICIGQECGKRGFIDKSSLFGEVSQINDAPSWFGDERIHSSHRSKLLWKGRVDSVCARLKQHFKCRSINTWLINNHFNRKDILTRGEVIFLEGLADDLHCPAISNYYAKFGWKEPDNLPYYWPVRKN